MGALKINVSSVDGQSWPLVLHQTLNQNSTGWGPGIKFLNASDSSSKWAGIGGMASSGYANNNDLVFYTQAEARFRMNNNTFYPIGDAIYNLGGPTVRWQDIYSVNFRGDSAILKAEYALRFTNINTEAYLAANSSEGLFLAVYGSGNSGKSIYLETYNTDIYHRKNGTNYKILTPNNGGFYTLTREDVGNSYNIDNLTFNGFFEVRASNEVTVSGAKPWDGYYGCVNFHEDVCKMQIAGSNGYGFAIRGVQKANATLASIPWQTLLTSANYNSYSPTLAGGGASGTWGINITGSASNADTLDGYHADSFASASNAWRYGGLTGDANNYIFNGAWRTLDSVANVPVGNGHLWTFNGDGAGNTCVQFSGTYNMSNIYYRSKWYGNGWTNWYTLLSSNNYNSYSPTLTGGGASGTWGINITGSAGSANHLNQPLLNYPGTNGTLGYCCFARITVVAAHTSRPTEFTLVGRHREVCRVSLRFDNDGTTDPSTPRIYFTGADYGVYAIKAATSTWDLYCSKSEGWDAITVAQVISAGDVQISYPGGFVTSVHANAIGARGLPHAYADFGSSAPSGGAAVGKIYLQVID